MKRVKPLGRKNYGSIPHLISSKLGIGDHHINEGQNRILTEKVRDRHDEVFVFEKYDGSNCGIAKINGQLVALTRSGYLADESEFEHYHDFAKWVHSNRNKFGWVKEGWRVAGEWLGNVVSIEYEYKDPFLGFDVFDEYNIRQTWEFCDILFHAFNIQKPRLLHKGNAIHPNKLKELLFDNVDIKYPYAVSERPEGLVYRVERIGKVDFLAKWVRSDFIAGKYLEGTANAI